MLRRIAPLALVLALGGCGTAGSKLPVSEMTARTNSAGVQVVDVDVHSFYFKPNRIVLKQGNKLVTWAPSLQTRTWMTNELFQKLGKRAERVHARLTLKGDFIYTHVDKPLFLDGEPFGPRPSLPFAKESGDKHPGGDFEMWFWLVP